MSSSRIVKLFFALLASAAVAVSQTNRDNNQGNRKPAKPRIVFTDDPELDDSNTIVRALLYSTDYTIEGLIYASSQYHWKGDGKGTKWFVDGREYTRFGLKDVCPCTSWRWEDGHFIDEAVDAYEKVYPNLKVHNPDYPTPQYLRSKIRYGNIEFDGEMSKDTPGSDFIKALILDNKPGPLYLMAGGGQSTIARALKSIEDQYGNTPGWPAMKEKISDKVVILPSGDQDNTGAKYIRPNWPNIRSGGGGGMRVPLAYGAQRGLSPEDAEYYSAKWTQENISGKGALGAFWRVWGDGKEMSKGDKFDWFWLSGFTVDQLKAMGYVMWSTNLEEKGSFLAEGDSGTFMGFLNFGLRFRDVNPPSRGGGGFGAPAGGSGFGGRGGSGAGGRGGSGFAGRGRGAAGPPGPDFIPVVWRDFAARIQWSVTPKFKDANHAPSVRVEGPLDLSVRPGATVSLSATTSDPDKNAVTVKWWQYRSLGTYPGEIKIANPTALKTSFQVPGDAKPGATIHVIVEATDNGSPALTHYQHVIATVAP